MHVRSPLLLCVRAEPATVHALHKVAAPGNARTRPGCHRCQPPLCPERHYAHCGTRAQRLRAALPSKGLEAHWRPALVTSLRQGGDLLMSAKR